MGQYFGEFAALLTAVFWTVTSLSFESAGKKVGSLQVNLYEAVSNLSRHHFTHSQQRMKTRKGRGDKVEKITTPHMNFAETMEENICKKKLNL